MRWIEGIHYSKNEDGSITCLRCQRQLKSSAAVGPHMNACYREEISKPSEEAPPKPSEEGEIEPLPTEEEALENMLKEMGVKRAKPIARLMAYSGWDNFEDLSNFLRLSGVPPDRVILCLEAWARHRGKTLPYSLMQTLQTERQSQYYMQPPAFQTQPSLTKEDLEAWYQSKKKEEEIERLKAEIEMLRGNIDNPKENEIEKLREEIRQMRENQILQRLEALERYTTSGISNPYAFLGLVAKEFGDIVKSSPLRHYVLTGELPSPKEVEKGAKEGIFSKISQKYIVEE